MESRGRPRLMSDASVQRARSLSLSDSSYGSMTGKLGPSLSGLIPSLYSDDSSIVSSLSTSYYAAIYEFCQGSFPRTLWEYGALPIQNPDNFKLFIVNTPVNSCSSDFNTSSTSLLATFEGISFYATYFQVFDIEARGFTRPLILVIANQQFDVITKVHSTYSKEFNDFVKRIQQPTFDKFPKDLQEFANSMQLVIDSSEKDCPALQSKMEQLKLILPLFNIDKIDPKNATPRTQEYFTIINNDLKSIEELTNLTGVTKDLEIFLSRLPYTRYTVNIASYAFFDESPLSLDFGGSSNCLEYGGFAAFALHAISATNEECSFSLCKFVENGIFPMIAYGLLSGQSLVIISSNTEDAETLANRLSVLCPYFRPNFYKRVNKINAIDALKYAIVVTENIEGDIKKYVNILDLDREYYAGDGCPPRSMVNTQLADCSSLNDTCLQLHLLTKLKATAAEFVITLAGDLPKNARSEDIISKIPAGTFVKEDAPILRYWVHSCTNRSGLKPILKGNRSPVGYSIAPF